MIKYPFITSLLSVFLLSLISFSLYGQDLPLTDLPRDFSDDTILFELQDAKVERKKNGKLKLNYELRFNAAMEEVLSKKHFSGKIVAKPSAEIKKLFENPELILQYQHILTYRIIRDHGTSNGIPITRYQFYIYNIVGEKHNEYVMNPQNGFVKIGDEGSANYSKELTKFLKELEKEKQKRF